MREALDGISLSMLVGFLVIVSTLILAGIVHTIDTQGAWLVAIGIGFVMIVIGFCRLQNQDVPLWQNSIASTRTRN